MRMILSVMAAGCAMALFAVTESEINAAIEKGSAFLLSRQKDDGHFSDPNTPALTALPVWALSGTKEARGAAVKKAVAYVLAA